MSSCWPGERPLDPKRLEIYSSVECARVCGLVVFSSGQCLHTMCMFILTCTPLVFWVIQFVFLHQGDAHSKSKTYFRSLQILCYYVKPSLAPLHLFAESTGGRCNFVSDLVKFIQRIVTPSESTLCCKSLLSLCKEEDLLALTSLACMAPSNANQR